MNPIDYILLGIVGLIFAMALKSCIQKFRSGNPCSACGGNCSVCKKKTSPSQSQF
ncbi:MAG: hypothetical protein IJ575_08830 [Selenomonadaceae bacterium]|nr:hypothetical protein [Selenomonadaceae bacterium]